MALFGRRRKEDTRDAELVDRLTARHAELAGTADTRVPQMLDELFAELGLETKRGDSEATWQVNLGEWWSSVAWQADFHTFHVQLVMADPSEPSLVYLAQNGDGLLSWHYVGDFERTEWVHTAVIATLAPFDPQIVIAALSEAARVAGNLELAQKLHARVEAPADPAAELEAALSGLGLESEPLADGPGRLVQTEHGPLALHLRHGGEVVAMSVELERSRQPENEKLAWWMLKLCAAMARIGVSGPDEQGQWIVTSGFVVPTRGLSPAVVAWGMINTLQLARQFTWAS
jgi:hypothetical protein